MFILNMTKESNNKVSVCISKSFSLPVLPTSPVGPWPPSVDFCDLLYCDQVYCCPSAAQSSTDSNITISTSPEISDISSNKSALLAYVK